MKVYSVKPNSLIIRVSDGRVLEFVERTAPLAIVADVIGDEEKAKRYLRFKWRWGIFDSWATITIDRAVTENQIRDVIAQIDGAAAENAPMIARQMRERPMVVSDRPAPGQEYSSNPDLKPNLPPKEELHVNSEIAHGSDDPAGKAGGGS